MGSDRGKRDGVFFKARDPGDKFGAGKQWMLNFRVRDLDAMLAQLRGAGAAVEDEVQEHDGIGRFAWLADPEATASSSGSPTS